MAYKIGDRMQQTLLPSSIDDYVNQDDSVRAYDTFVDALDFNKLSIPINPFKAGAVTYYPKQMVKLLVYGYSYGIRSSRKLERACYHNLSFIWLMAGLTPDYRTIARFRDKYKEQIKNILKQCVQMCIRLELIDGNSLFVDGSVFKANASLNNTYSKVCCQENLKAINEHIDKLIDQIQQIDQQEENQESFVKLKEQLKDKQQRKEKIQTIVNELNQRQKDNSPHQKDFYNTTDPECSLIHRHHKNTAGYNMQLVVDEKHGLIVSNQTTNSPNDAQLLSQQISQAQENLKHKPEVVCSDTGYYSLKDFSNIDKDVTLVVPTQKQVLKERRKISLQPFDKEQFVYDVKGDCYICPEGKPLKYDSLDKGKEAKAYKANPGDCQQCQHFGVCTSSWHGRVIKRSLHENLKEQLQDIYNSPQGQQIYRLRKQKAELPFGHFKRNLSALQFMLRGRAGANAEGSLLSTCFNIARMITLIGIPQLITALKTMA